MSHDMTSKEVASSLRIHPSTVREYLRAGRLQGYRLGHEWRVPEEEIKRLKTRGLRSPEDKMIRQSPVGKGGAG